MSTATPSNRGNTYVNVAILATLAIVLLNPSGLVGGWLATHYHAWQLRQAVGQLWPTLSSVDSRLIGPDEYATRTVVEFIDYECPSCRQIAEAVSQTVLSGRAEVVVRHFPLVSIHPNARNAALAAICSESYGRFEEAHHSLLSNDDWMRESDWMAWARSIGIGDSSGFQACLEDDATATRLAEDVRLAREIGVTGTPSFVTRRGVFGGVGGLATALAEADEGGPHHQERIVNPEPVFDTRKHPDPAVSAIGSLGRGLFLADGRVVALQDEKTLLFVDLATERLVSSAGGDGDGPGEFRTAGAAQRWYHNDSNLAIWDALSMRATLFSSSGDLVGIRTLPAAPSGRRDRLGGPGPYFSPVGMFSDGAMAFSDFPQSRTEARPPKRIMEADWEGGRMRTILDVPAHQTVSVLFGYRTWVEVADDQIIVADTETDSINVYDRTGGRLFSLGMPGQRVRVTEAHAERALEDRIKRDEGSLFRRMGFDLNRQYVPNEVVPPIDRTLVDSDGRLWVRSYLLPDDETQRWTIWRGADRLFAVEMARGWVLFDASGDLILVKETDQLDVPSAVVRRMEFARLATPFPIDKNGFVFPHEWS